MPTTDTQRLPDTDFGRFQANYQSWVNSLVIPQLAAALQEFIPAGGAVLDLGCGDGSLALRLAQHAERVVAVDLSPTMITAAERQRRQQGVNNVQLVVSDIERLALAPAVFDLVVSSFALHHTDAASTLAQIAQYVRPGGWLFLQEPICPVAGALRPFWYRWLALRGVPSLIRQVGVGQTVRIQRFQQSTAWIAHQVADRHWPAQQWQTLVWAHLRGASVTAQGDHVRILWQRPQTGEAQQRSRPAVQAGERAPSPIAVKRQYPRPAPAAYVPFPREAIEGSVVARFEEQVERHAHQIALRTSALELTYAELNAIANRLGRRVLAHSKAPVAILMDQDDPVIPALLGVLKAGAPYAVIDPADPVSRQRRILELTGAEVLVTTAARASSLSDCRTTTNLVYEEIQDKQTPDNLGLPLTADHLAAIFFTSGSTGEPKGVARDHRQFLHSTWLNTNTYYVAPTDRQSLLYFPGFTASVPNIYDTLLNGATLCSLNPRNLSASALLNWLRQERITHFNPPIGLWRGLLEASQPGSCWPDLRLVTLAGQPLYGRDVREFQAHFGPDAVLLYVLAMTEAGAVTQGYIDQTTVAGDVPVPAGYPVADKEIVIHNAMGEPVAPGELGQITITSAYLSLGYWQDEAETAKRFCALPEAPRRRTFLSNDRGVQRADGSLEFYGRGDSIVKVRGYRVDLAAIEAVLNSHPQLTQAAVVTRPRHNGELRLIAYLCCSKENGAAAPTDHALGAYLAASLPRYMIPERFIWLDAMPLTASGKLDRRSLPPPGTARPDLGVPFVAPRNALEQQIADMWAELLGLDEVGVEDNFFELGGDSILVMRLVCQMEQRFQHSVALRQFIFKPTIAHLATLFGSPREDAGGEAEQMDEDAAPPAALDNAELRRLYDTLEDQVEMSRLRDRERARGRPTPRRPLALRLLLRLPQPVALRLFYGVLQQSWVRRRFLPRQTALVQRFLAGFEPPPRQEHLMARCLFFGALTRYGLRAEIFPRAQAAGKIPLAGLDALAAARTRRQGVILLVSHTYQARYFRIFGLTQGGIGSVSLLIGNAPFDKVGAEHILYSRQLEIARQQLQQGQVIYIAPDVNRGHGAQMTLPFHGRMHPFRTSFAELALLTGAQLFFVASDLQRYDRLSFELIGPLDTGTTAMAHEERVRHLMLQYVAHLRQQWARNPWALPWWLMAEHLAYPPAA